MLSQAFVLLLAATGAVGTPLEHRAADGLNTRAIAAGKQYFGSATDNGELSDTPYKAILSNTADFGQITPANSMKWDAIEPSRNTFSYTRGDVIADLAATNGQKLRCHALVWHSQLPSWVTNGGFDNATLVSIMKNHITNTVTHYKGKCLHWDVVNEALNEDGTYRTNVFYNTIGEAYIPIAFAAASAADPSVKLYYNDYNIDTAGSKSSGAQRIVKLIKQYGAKIDGVGQQAHLIVGSSPSVSSWTANMNAFTALDVDVAITELDIRTTTPATAAAVTRQATDYANAVLGCKSVARCVGITIWDFTDKYSWIPSVFAGQGAALPWDENLVKKDQVYNAILNAWGTGSGTPTTSASPTTTKASTTTAAPTTTGTVAKWGQCGGSGYSGSTICASGSTCTFVSDWYSQCL
ncbi:endo-1,4-beta-xylanase precursor [Byssothecium circinans]|uniref:Beta-xylanase n=1 Tax=Byssothecium circinans TaxID=147558 RepID=A0A6A5T6T5_9PLEO|nr:endo-1,4-beta-xylanase precursor [Byssothecium circinans]KAF1948281.1 endo-1,4-beta-xylanase precursor [Byssothecium circinans]